MCAFIMLFSSCFQTERIKIIKTLCKDGGFLLDDGPLEQIASQTPGFTGSDLQSLIYTARITSIKDNSPLNAPKKQEGEILGVQSAPLF